jgi:hypothetical protein
MENINELKVLLNENKKIFLDKFTEEVTLYVLDAFKNRADIKKIEKDHSEGIVWEWHFGAPRMQSFIVNNWDKYGKTIEKYWMKPEFTFVVDNESFDDPIILIDYPGLEDATAYYHYTNVADEAYDEGEQMEEILGKRFYYYGL